MSARSCILLLAFMGIALALPQPTHAANIVIANADGAGEGFNDPNPPTNANQKGNNPGTSLGQMRLNVFNAVAAQLGAILNSAVVITVSAQFNPLACAAQSATLGLASTTGIHANFSGGEPSVAYHVALAESLAGANLNGGSAEMTATFNSALDSDVNCLGGGGFYYGLDGNAPVGTTPLLQVVLHELSHGLGFSSLANVNNMGDGAWPPGGISRRIQPQFAGSGNGQKLGSNEQW